MSKWWMGEDAEGGLEGLIYTNTRAEASVARTGSTVQIPNSNTTALTFPRGPTIARLAYHMHDTAQHSL